MRRPVILDSLRDLRREAANLAYLAGPARTYVPAAKRLAPVVAPDAGAFLDFGTGPGWLAIHVARARPDLEVVAADASPAMLAAARRHAGDTPVRIEAVDPRAPRLSAPDGHFASVATVQCAHHWTRHAPAILAELARVIPAGGTLHVLEADPEIATIPAGWLHRPGGWPPDALLRRAWRRHGADPMWWVAIKEWVAHAHFRIAADEHLGFYRHLAARRLG
jgi:ubiquinone/menaquinone biosynthesis C-methylase UbiE